MSKYYYGVGRVRYKKDGWVILECSNSIVNYYKRVVEKFIWKKVSTPLHLCHATVVPAKHEGDLKKHHNWGKHEGEVVQFKYYSSIQTDENGKYYWLVIDCPIIHQIRMELGLKPNLRWNTHITICYKGD